MMTHDDTILVTGARGLVGVNLVEHLRSHGFVNVIGAGQAECDLTDRAATLAYFQKTSPQYVFHLAGYIFGIMGNMKNQAESYFRNTLINSYVIEACHKVNVKKIVAAGTVAMYPDPLPSNPLREETIWMGKPHGSERGYAHAKRGMLAQLEVFQESYGMNYACALATNMYGPHDRYNVETGHVIPTLIRKFYEAKQSGHKVTVWGDGSSQRDFMYIKDAVTALHVTMEKIDGLVNVATGRNYTIRDAVNILAEHTGLQDHIVWDATKPNGQAFRPQDVSKLEHASFKCDYSFEQALRESYDWYAANAETARKK
jgi:GDP-L-fucose synthase